MNNENIDDSAEYSEEEIRQTLRTVMGVQIDEVYCQESAYHTNDSDFDSWSIVTTKKGRRIICKALSRYIGNTKLEEREKASFKPTVREDNPIKSSRTRVFTLVRDEDETGVSGTGTIAEGIEFSNGTVALTWLTPMASIVIYNNLKMVEAVHGHNGRTRIVFKD